MDDACSAPDDVDEVPGAEVLNSDIHESFLEGPPHDPIISRTSKAKRSKPLAKPRRHVPVLSKAEPSSRRISFLKWCENLVPNVLATRPNFSAYLSRTIQLSRSGRDDRATLTFFPIPVPMCGLFDRMPVGVPADSTESRAISKAIHVIVCALNFWYGGGSFGQLELLRRKPSRHHLQLYERLRLLLRSDESVEVDNMASAGRRFPELSARLGELSEALTKLGPSADPYDKTFNGTEVARKEEEDLELRPFHDMDPSKIKLFGRGEWDATEYLSDNLCMAYREPRSLLHGSPTDPGPHIRDSPESLAELATEWDRLGLLYLHTFPVHQNSFVRIFGAYKDRTTHRQIGDRRGQNQRECRLQGPSKDLPAGPDMCELFCNPEQQYVSISISDRRDFYHQLKATEAKAIGNTIGPGVPASLLTDTRAYAQYLMRQASKRRDREKLGDGLFADESQGMVSADPDHLWVSFKSVLQGDHAGVEIATESHTALLQESGLLQHASRMVASRPVRNLRQVDGLVIDDFFSISFEDRGGGTSCAKSEASYRTALEVYEKAGLLGSPHKDLVDVREGRVIGAYVNGGPKLAKHGIVSVSAPGPKRLGLSQIALDLCRLTHTTDALHLCLVGGIVSALCYRRPLMSLLQQCFHMVDMAVFDRDMPKLIRMPRKVCDELTLAACLMPLAMSDIAIPFSQEVFCTDASNAKRAILKTTVSKDVSEALYKCCKTKGAYSRLLTPLEQALKGVDALEEEMPNGTDVSFIHRPIAFHFEFIEVFAGASKITKYLDHKGVRVGPPLDLSISPEYDVGLIHVVEWLTFMLAEKRLRAFFSGPPCTTFSVMRRPRLRSKEAPLGSDPTDHQTQVGNHLALRALQLMQVGRQNGASGINETPYSSYMKHLPPWIDLKAKPEVDEVRCDSCRYGSVHLKSFRFLGLNVDLKPLSRRCICTATHERVEGSKTKGSATYTDELAQCLAEVLAQSIFRSRDQVRELAEGRTQGLENQLANEVMTSSPWEVVKCWSFKKSSHINILEESSVLKLCQILAKLGPKRFSVLVDSNVVLCATSKGRSSSRALSSILRRVTAIMVAAGLYISIPFSPTRLNCADDPTRDREVRSPTPGLGLDSLSRDDLFDLGSMPKLRRWASNWVRLILRTLGVQVLHFKDRSLFRQTCRDSLPRQTSHAVKDFDSSLGFPGEGPSDKVYKSSGNTSLSSKRFSNHDCLDFAFHRIGTQS